ncbi:MAG TPA: nitroreductase [Clostridiales bacterium]|nr:nitroreductase [Clostridiales bacterium]
MEYKKLISNRKSVRDYKKTALNDEHIKELKAYANKSKKLISDIEVEILIMGNEVFENLNGKAGYKGFMLDAPNYAILLSEKKDNYIKNAGYIGEEIVLKALDMQIGSCWVTFNDSDLVKSNLGINSDKEVVAIIALGYDDNKTKIINIPTIGANESKTKIEKVADNVSERLGVEDIVYLNKWGCSATADDLENRALLDAFHYARLAPSTLNRQPWRFILDDGMVVLAVRNDDHTGTYEEEIDAGIVMLYFEAIVDVTLTDITWILEAPKKDYNIPEEYVVVGYCNI